MWWRWLADWLLACGCCGGAVVVVGLLSAVASMHLVAGCCGVDGRHCTGRCSPLGAPSRALPPSPPPTPPSLACAPTTSHHHHHCPTAAPRPAFPAIPPTRCTPTRPRPRAVSPTRTPVSVGLSTPLFQPPSHKHFSIGAHPAVAVFFFPPCFVVRLAGWCVRLGRNCGSTNPRLVIPTPRGCQHGHVLLPRAPAAQPPFTQPPHPCLSDPSRPLLAT